MGRGRSKNGDTLLLYLCVHLSFYSVSSEAKLVEWPFKTSGIRLGINQDEHLYIIPFS